MADNILYRLPLAKDIDYVAEHMKNNDQREIIGMVGPGNVRQELEESVARSEFCRACLFAGEPVAIFGIRRMSPLENIGIVWLLTTGKTQTRKVFVGRTTKKAVQAFMEDWDLLYNYVDEGNKFSIRWLRWMGAKIFPARPFGIFGCRYHYFEFRK